MAKKDVVRLLVRLFGDPKLQDRMAANAAGVLKTAKLSAKERALILSGDHRAIQAYLGSDAVKANVVKTQLKNVANVVKTALKRPRKKSTTAKKPARK